MKKEIAHIKFAKAEKRMNDLLAFAPQKGGFINLTKKESAELNKFTQIVKNYEDVHHTFPFISPKPTTLEEIDELKKGRTKKHKSSKDLISFINK